MNTALKVAIDDFSESLQRTKLWVYLGWSDIKLRYKGSILGPLWITFSMLVFAGAFGFIYGTLFHQDPTTYIPFLTSGILIWNYIAVVIVESCDAFPNAKNFICQIKMAYLIHIYRVIWRNIIVFLHNSLVYILVIIYFGAHLNTNTLFFIPGFILLTLNLTCISLLLGVFASRYRDLPPVISSLIQIAFFISPITWSPNLLGKNASVVAYNPLYYFFDMVRSPLLGIAPEISSWWYCLVMTLFSMTAAGIVFISNRNKIPYWI